MSEELDDRYADDECDFADDAEDRDCFHCGGEGLVECRDPIQCTRPHKRVRSPYGNGIVIQLCPCASCGGSGLAKDMTIW